MLTPILPRQDLPSSLLTRHRRRRRCDMRRHPPEEARRSDPAARLLRTRPARRDHHLVGRTRPAQRPHPPGGRHPDGPAVPGAAPSAARTTEAALDQAAVRRGRRLIGQPPRAPGVTSPRESLRCRCVGPTTRRGGYRGHRCRRPGGPALMAGAPPADRRGPYQAPTLPSWCGPLIRSHGHGMSWNARTRFTRPGRSPPQGRRLQAGHVRRAAAAVSGGPPASPV
jgi:hypothetical protein